MVIGGEWKDFGLFIANPIVNLPRTSNPWVIVPIGVTVRQFRIIELTVLPDLNLIRLTRVVGTRISVVAGPYHPPVNHCREQPIGIF